eukprot:6195066-Pleurochrysis_carterae.AAC.2
MATLVGMIALGSGLGISMASTGVRGDCCDSSVGPSGSDSESLCPLLLRWATSRPFVARSFVPSTEVII